MDIRIPEELRANIPQLGEASEQDDPMLWLKLTCEQAGWTWYIIEMQPLEQDAIFYGYKVGWDEELTYFNQSDLELSSAEWGFPIVQDEGFAPCRLSEVQAAGEHPTTFVRRHWRGDWGEVDAHDQQENEFSLVNGLRLLSAYTLKDGTRIWIITEADRSATTILLPSEY